MTTQSVCHVGGMSSRPSGGSRSKHYRFNNSHSIHQNAEAIMNHRRVSVTESKKKHTLLAIDPNIISNGVATDHDGAVIKMIDTE
jgi:hypothetical protein